MRYGKPMLLFAALALVVGLVALPAGAATATLPVLVSGPSPYASCAVGSGPGAINYTNAEVEPYVAVNPTNTANLIGVWQQDRWSDGGAHGLVAGFSSDGGKTWGETTLPFSACAGGLGYERASDPWVSFGPDGTAYAVSISFNESNNNNAVAAATSPDGGKTWSSPRVIVNTPSRQQTIGNQIVADPRNGTLYDFFDLISPPFNVTAFKVAFIKSTDGGATWTKPKVIADLRTVFVSDPNTGRAIRTGDIIPEPAIDPATGQLYVVWQDSRFTGGHFDEVALSTSTDRGASWSAPIQVNANTPSSRPGFTPTIRVSSSGTVGVSFYDFRNLTTETTTLPTDYWFVDSTNHGASFGNEVHLAGPFDMLTAPNAGGFFVGDYEAIDTSSTTFDPFFVQANSGNTSNRTDVFTTTVTP